MAAVLICPEPTLRAVGEGDKRPADSGEVCGADDHPPVWCSLKGPVGIGKELGLEPSCQYPTPEEGKGVPLEDMEIGRMKAFEQIFHMKELCRLGPRSVVCIGPT